MSDPQTIAKVAETGGLGSFTWVHLISGMIIAGLTGGFFNPIWKFIAAKYGKKNKNSEQDASIKVAEIQKEGRTEDKLWERVESLEKDIKQEIEKRLASEKIQGELQRQIDELKREKLFTLSRYIHLKLRIEEAKREIQYLKAKLMEKDPDFDKDYPNFSMDSRALEDEKLITDIVNENNDYTDKS
jgi:hypothetical protein